jgi:hypothetical protein
MNRAWEYTWNGHSSAGKGDSFSRCRQKIEREFRRRFDGRMSRFSVIGIIRRPRTAIPALDFAGHL